MKNETDEQKKFELFDEIVRLKDAQKWNKARQQTKQDALKFDKNKVFEIVNKQREERYVRPSKTDSNGGKQGENLANLILGLKKTQTVTKKKRK